METTVDDDVLRKNYGYLLVGIILAFVILISKIWYLQMIKGGEFIIASDQNRIRNVRLAAPRGDIYDYTGRVLATNKPSFDLYFNPRAITGKTKEESQELRISFLESACKELDVDFELVNKRFKQGDSITPIKVKTDINWEELARIKTLSMSYEGESPLSIEGETKRDYPHQDMFAHFLGYIAEIDQKRLDSPDYVGYRPGDFVGKVGVESTYEKYLKGDFGSQKVEENARNVILRTLEISPPMPGKNLELTVDIDLTQAAARAMRNFSGAVVALDVRNGDVLCALSTPGYDPQIFSRLLPKSLWDKLLDDPRKPLNNKVIGNAYPPGSTWKLVTAVAGLESGAIKASEVASCGGKWKYGDREFRCWNEKGHGLMNLHKAIVHSCDVYFYKLSVKVGIDEISRWAHLLGAGEKTGIDVTPETKGVIPSKEWKLNTLGSEWIPGETLSCAIGQGYNQVSPLQLALVYATVANGGTVYRPRVVNEITTNDGKIVQKFEPEVIRKVEMKPSTITAMRKALAGVVNEPGGTGHQAHLNDVLVAGKTGTAQVRRIKKQRIHISNMEYKYRDHAWFAGFAPAYDPEIAVVVLCEHSGHGGTVAAPVARAVIAKYFEKKEREKPAPLPE